MTTKPRCKDHGIEMPCHLCLHKAWPVRDIRAVADFAGSPVNGPDGLIPGVEYIALSEAVRQIGRKMRDLEAIRLELFKPFYTARKRLRGEAFSLSVLEVGKVEQAANYLAQKRPMDQVSDPIVKLFMQTIEEDESSW
ncbi:MAG: hypothetical protein WC982_05025 [Advenella sp.]